jgi:hypothetical protein
MISARCSKTGGNSGGGGAGRRVLACATCLASRPKGSQLIGGGGGRPSQRLMESNMVNRCLSYFCVGRCKISLLVRVRRKTGQTAMLHISILPIA